MTAVGRGISTQHEQTRRWRQSMEQANAQTRALALNTERLASSAASAPAGFNRLRAGLSQVTVGLLSTQSAAASVVTGALASFGVGAGWLLGITAGIAGLALLYNRLTGELKKAREATDEFVKSQNQAARARRERIEPVFAVERQFGGTREEEGLTTRMARLNADLASLQKKAAEQGAGGLKVFARELAEVRRQIQETATAAEESGRTFLDTATARAKAGEDLVKSLRLQVATFGMSAEAARRYAIAQDESLLPATKAVADGLLRQIERMRTWREFFEDLREDIKRFRAPTAKELEFPDVGASLDRSFQRQNRARLDAINLRNQWGTVDPDRIADLRRFNQAQQRENEERISREAAAMREQQAAAALWRETWTNAIRGTQDAIADFFDNLGREGANALDVLREVAQAIKRTLAEAAAQQVVGGILGGLFRSGLPGAPAMGSLESSLPVELHHAGGVVGVGGPTRRVPAALFAGAPRYHRGGWLAPGERPIIAQDGERVQSRAEVARERATRRGAGGAAQAPVVMHLAQTVTFNLSAIDGASAAAFIRAQGPAIAGEVARAAADAPGFARYLLAQGSR